MDDPTIFDGAKLRLQIKQSRQGTDPVVGERDFTAIEGRREDSTSNADHNGHYRTPRSATGPAPAPWPDTVSVPGLAR
ncbi:hypothetical protein OOK31_17970 [Streptomyces sp. NBC_00249]|uniref:hypothetical protein n=1 Tax=Streptomyces sp. NBC_00249 TaxID=2975690 RepID=UPI002250DB21|nr:hypothetical protein [Streptomyces sp. NBC_00249]MCX5195761.1 hypothetical protein [Streptomyces sp. NBC_00249]